MPVQQLQQEPMMERLIGTLDAGHSIGHYGRLVFTMVARHFLEPEEVLAYLEKDPECDAQQARSLLSQVEARNYNPPKRERILDWMRRQEFPICPDPGDPGQCNVYRNLEFPKEVYEQIEQFHFGAISGRESDTESQRHGVQRRDRTNVGSEPERQDS